ncbi:hypothetical protein MPSEU_000399800 [Mayamaea pseudoterrestris]|nr:hypothetical protein MPSEU_000399800 [Mayamaea pseudoterrestris]
MNIGASRYSNRRCNVLLISSIIFNSIYWIISESKQDWLQSVWGTFSANESTSNTAIIDVQSIYKENRCAINFYGLPRAFKDLVLPSVIRNVININANHTCDYYIHYYNVTFEPKGRIGMQGGQISPMEIFDIREYILNASAGAPRPPLVAFIADTDDEFQTRRNETLQKIRHVRDPQGKYLYFPWIEPSYLFPGTVDNIIKMWHSIQSVWSLMEEHELMYDFKYSRVAMMRSDVVYMTPIDIFLKADGGIDIGNNEVVIPYFASYPVNDRLIYGPRDAVVTWATGRFGRMDSHANATLHIPREYGWSMHPERFVANEILPAILENGFHVTRHPTLCLLRARPGNVVWAQDCHTAPRNAVIINSGLVVEDTLASILGRNCTRTRDNHLQC